MKMKKTRQWVSKVKTVEQSDSTYILSAPIHYSKIKKKKKEKKVEEKAEISILIFFFKNNCYNTKIYNRT